jgi:hypothetical protein
MALRGIRNERSYIRSPIAAIGHFIESIERSIPPIELSIPRLHRSMRLINRSIRRMDRSIPAMEISIPCIHRSISPMGESIRRSHRSIPPIKRSIRQDGRPIRRKEPRSPALARRSSRAGQSGLTFAPAAAAIESWLFQNRTAPRRHRPERPNPHIRESTYSRTITAFFILQYGLCPRNGGLTLAPNDPLPADRSSEWFVPRFGSPKFRTAVGLLFLPYTAMVLSFCVIGSMLAHELHWDRVAAITLIYALGLGIGAHALDALGSKAQKPWGTVFDHRQLWLLAGGSLAAAYLIAAYYMMHGAPNLAFIALIEGFFVFAYNLEWFEGRFHTDGWFAFSWGFLPVLAGFTMQTNTISFTVLWVALSMALFSLVEIKASRPYKALKQRGPSLGEMELLLTDRYEAILKSVSLGTVALGLGLLLFRLFGQGWQGLPAD